MKPCNPPIARPVSEMIRMADDFFTFTIQDAQSITGLDIPVLEVALQHLIDCDLLYVEYLEEGTAIYEWNAEKIREKD